MVDVNPFTLIGVNLSAPPAPGYTRGTRVTAPNGHYLDFSTAVTWGLFADGMPWFIADGATITGRSPTARSYLGNTIDGFTYNPALNGTQGYDQRVGNYAAPPAFPITPRKMDVLVSAQSQETTAVGGGNAWRDGYFSPNGQAWFTCLTKPPAAGAFSPPAHWPSDDVNRLLRPIRVPDVDGILSRMPSYSTSGISSPPSWSSFATSIDQPNVAWLSNAFNGSFGDVGPGGYEGRFPRGFSAASMNYGFDVAQEISRASMAAALNHWTSADKRAFLVRMLQHGNQWVEPMTNSPANSIPPDGGHWNWHWAPIAMWLDATNQNARSASLLGIFPGNLAQVIAITASHIANDLIPHDSATKPHSYRRRTLSGVSGLDFTLQSFPLALGDGTWPELTNTIMTRESDGDTSRITAFNQTSYATTAEAQASPVWANGNVVYHAPGYTLTEGMVVWSLRGSMGYEFTTAANPTYSDLQAWAGPTLLLASLGIISPELQNLKTWVANCATGTYPAASPYNFVDSRKTTLETQVWNAHWTAASAVSSRF